MTFSIVAFDRATRELGIAVQSKFLAVGAVVPWAKADVGAIATQSWANTTYGPRGLALLEEGLDAQQVVARLTADDPDAAKRQCGIVDAQGRAATFTGAECFAWAGGITGDGFCAQGNILAGAAVVDGIARAFVDARGALADRLVAALHGGQREGGDRRGMQSAALLVVKAQGGYGGFNDRYIDLRVDDHARPIDELERVLALYKLYFRIGEPTLRAMDAATAGELQRIAVRAGHYHGAVDGTYGTETKAALRALFGVENLEERWSDADEIDEAAFAFLRARYPD